MVAVLEAKRLLLVGNLSSHLHDYRTELKYQVVRALDEPLHLANRWIEKAVNAVDEVSDPGQ
jgi:hypothetical protein